MSGLGKRLILLSCIACIAIACVCPITSMLRRLGSATEESPEVSIPEFVTEEAPTSEPQGDLSPMPNLEEPGQSAEGMLELADSQLFTSYSVTKAVFAVKNSSAKLAVVESKAQVDVYSEDDKVLDTQPVYIPALLPNQKMYYVVYLNTGPDVKIGKVDIALQPGQAKSTDLMQLPVDISDLTYFQSQSTNISTAVLENSSREIIRDINLTLVGFDKSGKIVTLGTGYQSLLPPDKKIPVQMYTEGEQEPAKIELYPSINYLGSAYPDEWIDPPIEVLRTQVISKDGRTVAIAELKSSDEQRSWINASFILASYDASGTVLTSQTWPITNITPGQTFAITSDLFVPAGQKLDHLEVIPMEIYPAQKELDPNSLTIEKADFLADDYTPKVSGIIRNNLDVKLVGIPLAVVIEDGSGRIIGGGTGYVDTVEAGGTSAYVVNVFVDGKPDKVAVYPLLPYLD